MKSFKGLLIGWIVIAAIALLFFTSLNLISWKSFNFMNYVSLLVLLIIVYSGAWLIHSINWRSNTNILSGLIILLLSLAALALGYWDITYVSKPFILAVAMIAVMITLRDLINHSTLPDKKIINVFVLSIGLIYITIILLITHSSIQNRIAELNMDYLAFVALGISLSSVGIRNKKK